jgi:hypothetical protein
MGYNFSILGRMLRVFIAPIPVAPKIAHQLIFWGLAAALFGVSRLEGARPVLRTLGFEWIADIPGWVGAFAGVTVIAALLAFRVARLEVQRNRLIGMRALPEPGKITLLLEYKNTTGQRIDDTMLEAAIHPKDGGRFSSKGRDKFVLITTQQIAENRVNGKRGNRHRFVIDAGKSKSFHLMEIYQNGIKIVDELQDIDIPHGDYKIVCGVSHGHENILSVTCVGGQKYVVDTFLGACKTGFCCVDVPIPTESNPTIELDADAKETQRSV